MNSYEKNRMKNMDLHFHEDKTSEMNRTFKIMLSKYRLIGLFSVVIFQYKPIGLYSDRFIFGKP